MNAIHPFRAPLLLCFGAAMLVGMADGAAAPNPRVPTSSSSSPTTTATRISAATGTRTCRRRTSIASPAEGMRFDRMFVGCPQCVPSRATLMTGRSAVAVRMVRFTSPLPADLPRPARPAARQGRLFHRRRRAQLSPRRAVRHRASTPARRSTRRCEKHGLRTFTNRVDYVEKGGGHEGLRRQAGRLPRRRAQGQAVVLLARLQRPASRLGHEGPARRARSGQAHAAAAPARPARRAQRPGPLHRRGRAPRRRRAERARHARSARSCARTRSSSSWATTAWPCRTARARCTIRASPCRCWCAGPAWCKPGGVTRHAGLRRGFRPHDARSGRRRRRPRR